MPPKKGGKRPPTGPKAARNRYAPPTQRNFSAYPSTAFAKTVADSDGHGFSMRDEARNTQSHHTDVAWTSGATKLRQKPVTFVSAGFIEPLKDLPQESDSPRPDQLGEDPSGVMDVGGDNVDEGGSGDAGLDFTEVVEVITAVGEEEVTGPELTVKDRTDGDTGEADEPEEAQTRQLFCIDLVGDKSKSKPSFPPPIIPTPRSSAGESDSSEEIILFRGRSANSRKENKQISRTAASTQSVRTSATSSRQIGIIAPSLPTPQLNATTSSHTRGKRTKLQRTRSSRVKGTASGLAEDKDDDNEEDEILADYIANMAANGEDDFIVAQPNSFNSRRDLGGDNFAFDMGSGDENDLPAVESISNGDEELSESDDSDAEGDENQEEIDDDMDADMDDETLARLLAKQEELGIGGEDLILADSLAFVRTGQKSKKSRRSNGQASASAVADALDDLDLADWVQPVPRKRRSKQPPNFNVSDSEIEAALRTAWSRDRERKKTRKMEREALRAQGLLGKNSASSPDDLRVKYPMGFKIEDFKSELALFLVSSDERLEFPPLDTHARKVLHQLANKFNVKSKSTGSGQSRRPVLFRTNRTITYKSTQLAEATRHVEAAAAKFGRRYFHRADVNPRTDRDTSGGGIARVSMKALVLREGEVVGASAPELGQENKGRAMLEKMGWSKGMALGAVENKGILEPVAQVVKKSKAGLGRTNMDW